MKRQETILSTLVLSLLCSMGLSVPGNFADNIDKSKAKEAKPKLTPAQKQLAKRMAGRFIGRCQIGGKESIKMSTELTQDSSGWLTGAYTMDIKEPTEHQEQGTLQQVAPAKGQSVTFAWKDVYGKGTLQATFNGDFSHFDGTWGATTETGTWSWSGDREKVEIQPISPPG
jgi:hypothetical protein